MQGINFGFKLLKPTVFAEANLYRRRVYDLYLRVLADYM